MSLADISSSTYPLVLAVWLTLVGNLPAAPLFLNVLLYALAAVVVIWPFSKQESAADPVPAAAMMAGFAFSPTLTLLSAQPLKDTLFVAAVMLAAVGLWLLLRRSCTAPERPEAARGLARGLLATTIGVFVVSGIRGVLRSDDPRNRDWRSGLWLLNQTRRTLVRFGGLAVTTVACIWLATSTGGGVYYDALAQPVLIPIRSAFGTTLPSVSASAMRFRSASPCRA